MEKKNSNANVFTNLFMGLFGFGVFALVVILIIYTLLRNSGHYGGKMYAGGIQGYAFIWLFILGLFGTFFICMKLPKLIKNTSVPESKEKEENVFEYIDKDDLNALKSYLIKNPDQLKIKERFTDPFSYAIKNRKLACANVFLELGFNINQQLPTGHSYLDLAINNDDYETVKFLFKYDINFRTYLYPPLDPPSRIFPDDRAGLGTLQRAKDRNLHQIVELIINKINGR